MGVSQKNINEINELKRKHLHGV